VASSDLRCASTARAAAPTSGTSSNCTWAVITAGVASAWKPPAARTIRAALLAAATTLGSSTAMGTT
jgi:hypothetical protein